MTHLHEEIRELNELLARMARGVQEMFVQAVQSVAERDSRLADEVIRRDEEIDALEIEVDDRVVRLLACYQPVAVDLRAITNFSKISGNLERMADLATKVAKAAIQLNQRPPLSGFREEVARLAGLSRSMMADAIRAFLESDTALAREVRRRDDDVDRLRDEIFHAVKQRMQQDPDSVERCVSLILIASALERLADHATNIAEDVVDLVEGIVIKHHHAE